MSAMPSIILGPRGERVYRARFDAGTVGGPERGSPQTARFIYRDITPSERRRLMDGSADLADNSPIFRGLFERLVTYVIGCGIWPQSGSTDAGFNAEADAVFEAFAQDCDIRGGISWPILQSQLFRSELRDGDGGTILTRNNGEPMVWACEGRQIGDPLAGGYGEFFDGVKLDASGRPISYRVYSESATGVRGSKDVEAANFVHIYDPERCGLVRGVPLIASALNTGRDVHEILALEKLAVKDASSKTDIVTTENGEEDVASLYARGGATLNGSDGEESRKYYRQVFGPEAKYIRRGDAWEAYKSERPGPAWQGFMDFLSQTICLAARIPPSVLLQIKVGGADTRRDLAAAARVFEMMQVRLAHQFARIRNYVVEFKLQTLPADWKRISWQFPKAITVDAGREAAQDREDVRAGLMTEQEYQGRWGQDWRRHRIQVEAEATDRIRRAKSISQKEGVPFELALQMLGVSTNPPNPAGEQVQPTGGNNV